MPYAIIFAAMNPSSDDLRSTFTTPPAIEELIDSDHYALFSALRELTALHALPVYLVGGPVRDWLIGWQVRDLDFVVEGDAPSLAQILAQRTAGRVIVHNRFGTATVELEGARIDLVTARKEVYPVPGALPEVEPSSLEDDLARRDFTINAMALPIAGDVEGVMDPIGGRDDLRDGLIRTIHPGSFSDDPTRLFRAVRYEQRLGYTLSEETLNQFKCEVDGRGCDNVSGDRLRHELELIFREQCPNKALLRASELGLLSSVLSGFGQGEYVARWAASGKDDESQPGAEWRPWLAALAYPLNPADGDGLIRRLNMPRAWAGVVRGSIELRVLEPRLVDDGLPLSTLARLLEGHDAQTIGTVAGISDSPEVARNLGRFLEGSGDLKPALNGADLLALGVPRGPMVGRTLATLRDMRLDRRVNSEAEERQWVKSMVASHDDGSGS